MNMYQTVATPKRTIVCIQCAYHLEPGARFCGDCGAIVEAADNSKPTALTVPNSYSAQAAPPVVPDNVSYDDLEKLQAFRMAQIKGVDLGWKPTPSPGSEDQRTLCLPPTGGAPTFASVASSRRGAVSPQLIREMQSLHALLLREQLFLIMHWSIFLITNLIGFAFALKCYHGLNGDEVSKIVMALTPLTFINAVGLACLAPIKGTRREIARVKEKMQYVRFQMEVNHVL
ncbi:MAG: hypothetical protein K2Z81_13600 [Cyanobacteria bacterium]|nr:hypothetical protein [Cyanobacteriota bacterium]